MSKFFTLISLFILVFITKNYSQDWKWFKSQGSKNEVFREYTSNIKCFKNAVYVSGTFEDTIVFGQDTLKSGQRSQLFVAKLDTSGKPIWAKQFYAVQHNVNSTSSLEIDKNENIYVGGLTRNITIAGKDTLFSNGNNIGFLSKFTAAGALKFTKQFYLQKGTYGVTGTEVLKVFIDAKNRIHVLGFYGVQLEDTLIIENKKFY